MWELLQYQQDLMTRAAIDNMLEVLEWDTVWEYSKNVTMQFLTSANNYGMLLLRRGEAMDRDYWTITS